jgi:predicted metalloprotease
MAGYLLFRDPPGTSPTDPAAHGSAFDRVSAFQEGFFGGTGVCIRYEQGDFDVVSIPLTLADLTFGGDLPFEEVVPAIVPALEIYWAETYPVLFGSPWDPVAAAGPYFPSTGALPSCGEQEPDPAQYVDSAVYCPQDDFVAWDGENLFPDLYESIGDFALAMVLAHEWATAVQVRAGLPFEGLDAELQADCLSGAWAAFMVPQDNPTEIVLSAGDLDEAVSGFLAFSEEPDGAAMTGTAFDRFDAFEDGFFNGPQACLGA